MKVIVHAVGVADAIWVAVGIDVDVGIAVLVGGAEVAVGVVAPTSTTVRKVAETGPQLWKPL